MALAAEIVSRVQFRTNRAQLQKLDDASVDDDDETEWQQYLRVCIETVMKVLIEYLSKFEDENICKINDV